MNDQSGKPSTGAALLKAKLQMSGAMLIFGTIGIFRRYIPLSSAALALWRAVIGAVFIALFMLLSRRKLDFGALKRSVVPLLLSGAAIGLNWIALFEAYRFTTVAAATLCYYTAPVFVILASPPLLHEKLSARGICCAAAAMCGMALISGADVLSGEGGLRGIALGLCAAALYAAVIILNKKITGVRSYDKTLCQLISAAAVLLPYTLLTGGFVGATLTARELIMLLVMGALHTGAAYVMYFGALGKLSARSTALLGYIDPLFALLLSAFILRESMGVLQLIGAALIIGSAAVGELADKG